jgi:alpha-L-fucosidase 2
MVYGTPEKEHLQLNEESLWAGCPENPYPEEVGKHYEKFRQLNLAGKYEEALAYGLDNLTVNPSSIRSYETLGDIYLDFGHKNTENYKRKLDLETGITTVEYEINGNRFKRESFISSKYDAIFYRFESIDDKATSCSINFDRKKDIKFLTDNEKIIVDGQIFDDPNGYDDNPGGSGEGGDHMRFAAHIGLLLDNGKTIKTDSTIQVKDTRSFTVVVGAATDYNLSQLNFDRRINPHDLVSNVLETAINTSYTKIKEEHIKTHASIFNRVRMDISGVQKDTIPTNIRMENLRNGTSDPHLMELVFQYGRYLLMASSGGKAVLPANLQGIWNKDMWAAWEADYHLNINLQMNYWPADVCNLSETFLPLTNFMEQLAKAGHNTADKFLGSQGWMAHHVANPFGRTTPSGSTADSQINNGYCFPLAGAWMSLSLWRHFEFTQDKKYLEEKTYPVIKGAARFILDFLSEDMHGRLVTAPSYSPENSYIDPVSGKGLRNTIAATMDIQIIRDVFHACMEAEKILGLNELTKEISKALPKLPEMKIGADGTIQEWIEDYKEVEPEHRHMSHLYGLYPSNQITRNHPLLFEAAEKTILKRLKSGGGQTGWSRAWVINFYARLGKGDACLKHINTLIGHQFTDNLFDLHPPNIFQIDGNLGATAGIAEMFLQSHMGEIVVLPALPDVLPKGNISGICARGGFELSFNWIDGQIEKVNVKSKAGKKCVLRYKNYQKEFTTEIGKTYAFNGILEQIIE